MNKGLEYYKDFIDGLVSRKDGVLGEWILKSGYPDSELMNSLSQEHKELIVKLVQEARMGGIHDTLAYMNEMMDLDGLVLSKNGERFVYNEFESMHFDFICRCEGVEWPE